MVRFQTSHEPDKGYVMVTLPLQLTGTLGEGWGEGEKLWILKKLSPPLNPLPPGEGKLLPLYESIQLASGLSGLGMACKSGTWDVKANKKIAIEENL